MHQTHAVQIHNRCGDAHTGTGRKLWGKMMGSGWEAKRGVGGEKRHKRRHRLVCFGFYVNQTFYTVNNYYISELFLITSVYFLCNFNNQVEREVDQFQWLKVTPPTSTTRWLGGTNSSATFFGVLWLVQQPTDQEHKKIIKRPRVLVKSTHLNSKFTLKKLNIKGFESWMYMSFISLF